MAAPRAQRSIHPIRHRWRCTPTTRDSPSLVGVIGRATRTLQLPVPGWSGAKHNDPGNTHGGRLSDHSPLPEHPHALGKSLVGVAALPFTFGPEYLCAPRAVLDVRLSALPVSDPLRRLWDAAASRPRSLCGTRPARFPQPVPSTVQTGRFLAFWRSTRITGGWGRTRLPRWPTVLCRPFWQCSWPQR
jgi:hypothetical protein